MEPAERIKQKADELMMQYGIRSVSMDDIATALGMSKKTIYQYFADKDELVKAIIHEIINHNQQCCLRDKSVALNAVHEVFLAIDMMQEMFQNLNPTVLYDLEKFHPAAFAQFLTHKYDFLYRIITQNLQRGIAEDLYRPDIDTDILVKARLEIMMLAFNQQVYPKKKYRLIEVETQLTVHFLYGVATSKGYKLITKYQNERTKK
jgi:TetR/AcrR family transcriptional regulator, cholesterol catabolism regulator